ncbi:hypothetical protein D3C79_1033410 [compost metagenome]
MEIELLVLGSVFLALGGIELVHHCYESHLDVQVSVPVLQVGETNRTLVRNDILEDVELHRLPHASGRGNMSQDNQPVALHSSP